MFLGEIGQQCDNVATVRSARAVAPEASTFDHRTSSMRLNSPLFHTARVARGPSQIGPRSDRQVTGMRDRSCITQCSGNHQPRIEAPGPTPTQDTVCVPEGES
jgi:hypothetical protein